MNIRSLLVLLCWLVLPAFGYAQPVRWERSLGGTASTSLSQGKATPDGGFVTVGFSQGGRALDISDSTRASVDVWVAKFDAQGVKQWDHRYGGDIASYGTSIWPTQDGGLLVGGQTQSGRANDQSEPSRGYEDYWVLKLDAQGVKQWDRRFGTDTTDYLRNVWQVADGTFMVAGTSSGGVNGDRTQPSRGSDDYWVLHLDAQGHKLWDRAYGGDNDETLGASIPTADGGSLLTGATLSTPSGEVSQSGYGNTDYWIVKLDALGNVQWDRRYGGLDGDGAQAALQNPDGSYYINGVSESGIGGTKSEPSRGDADCWVLKLSTQGALLWDRRFGTTGYEFPTSGLVSAAGGGCLFLSYTDGGATGDKSEPGRGNLDYWLVNISASGTRRWDRTYGGNNVDVPLGLCRVGANQVAMVGGSFSGLSGDKSQSWRGGAPINDAWVVRVDSVGTKLGDLTLGNAGEETQHALLQTRTGDFLLAGSGRARLGLDKSDDIGYGLNEFWLLRRDSLGVGRWDVSFTSSRQEYLRTMQEQADLRLFLAGTAQLNYYTISTGTDNDANFVAYRLSAQGVMEWRQEYGGPGDDHLGEARQTADGGYALGGTSRSGIGRDKTEASRGSADFWALKLTSTRVKQWDHRYGGTGLDSLVTMRQTTDGGYILAGSTTSPVSGDVTEPGRGGADFWLVKVNNLGVVQWQHRYGGPGPDWLAQARPTPDGGFVLVGTTTSGIGGEMTEASRGSRDLWVVKVSSTGGLQWQHRFGGNSSEYAAAVEVDPDGGYILGASTTSPVSGEVSLPSRGGTDYWLLRLSAQGTVLWDQRLGGSGEDVLTCLALTKGYGYALGGQSNSPTASGEHQQANRGGYDYWTLVLGARRVPPPIILSFTPGLGLPGTVVTLTGTGFTGTSNVTFNGTAAPGFVVSNGGTTITVTLPVGATTGLIAVTANGTGTSTTPFVVPGDLVISTPQSVQGTYGNVTVTGPATGGAGVGTLSGPLTVLGGLIVQDGGTLLTACQPLTGPGSFTLAAGATLGICDTAGISATGPTGAVQLAGIRSFSPDASYIYNGTQAQVTGDGLPGQVRLLGLDASGPVALTQPVALRQELRLSTGALNLNGQPLTLLSDASGTAQVNQNGTTTTGTVSGSTAVVQRYVSPATNPGLGYRHFAAPVASPPVSDLAVAGGYQPVVNALYNSSPTPGTALPFPTVFGYDQSRLATTTSNYSAFDKGWFSPAALTDPLLPGRGYTVQLAASQTVHFVGALNQGSLPVTLARNTGPTAADAGWQLLGNPYPSAFDLSSLNGTPGVDDAKYLFRSSGHYVGTYDTYLNGTTSTSPIIAVGQGFFARVTPGIITTTLTFANQGRVVDNSPATTFQRTTETRPLVELALVSPATGQRDRTTLYAEAGATAGLDAAFDARKLHNPSGLNLAQVAGGTTLAVQGLPALTSATVVPLTVGVPAAGTYALALERLLNLPASTQVWLTDTLTGQRLDVRTLPVAGYTFTLTPAQAAALVTGRFFLNLQPGAAPLTTVQGLTNAALSLYPNPAHTSTTVLLPAVPGTTTATLTLIDALGRVARTQTVGLSATGLHHELHLAGLAVGVYALRVQAGDHLLTRRLVVD